MIWKENNLSRVTVFTPIIGLSSNLSKLQNILTYCHYLQQTGKGSVPSPLSNSVPRSETFRGEVRHGHGRPKLDQWWLSHFKVQLFLSLIDNTCTVILIFATTPCEPAILGSADMPGVVVHRHRCVCRGPKTQYQFWLVHASFRSSVWSTAVLTPSPTTSLNAERKNGEPYLNEGENFGGRIFGDTKGRQETREILHQTLFREDEEEAELSKRGPLARRQQQLETPHQNQARLGLRRGRQISTIRSDLVFYLDKTPRCMIEYPELTVQYLDNEISRLKSD